MEIKQFKVDGLTISELDRLSKYINLNRDRLDELATELYSTEEYKLLPVSDRMMFKKFINHLGTIMTEDYNKINSELDEELIRLEYNCNHWKPKA